MSAQKISKVDKAYLLMVFGSRYFVEMTSTLNFVIGCFQHNINFTSQPYQSLYRKLQIQSCPNKDIKYGNTINKLIQPQWTPSPRHFHLLLPLTNQTQRDDRPTKQQQWHASHLWISYSCFLTSNIFWLRQTHDCIDATMWLATFLPLTKRLSPDEKNITTSSLLVLLISVGNWNCIRVASNCSPSPSSTD